MKEPLEKISESAKDEMRAKRPDFKGELHIDHEDQSNNQERKDDLTLPKVPLYYELDLMPGTKATVAVESAQESEQHDHNETLDIPAQEQPEVTPVYSLKSVLETKAKEVEAVKSAYRSAPSRIKTSPINQLLLVAQQGIMRTAVVAGVAIAVIIIIIQR